ncbi:hypothetical protein HKCCE2091_14380 [Rhodobacterales bacterium HKCCE2091]|nr:hypothetical protein [Rhodobacterales bacterium HKCCE2091]
MDDYPYDLGPHTFPVTATADAQRWFDRGLLWTYGFNHEEAIRCFARAAEADPACAMAQWGIAWAAGPNYNMPWGVMDEAGRAQALATSRAATLAALELSPAAAPWEQALIAALPARFPQADPLDPREMAAWDDAFATALRTAQAAFPDNREIRAAAVEAMMQRTPWAMWDIAAGTPADGADTAHCRRLLEQAFADDPAAWAHPGLLHLYVHLMEMSPHPELALRHGDVLRRLVPDAGHLVHMPTHIDVQCGAYHDAVSWNEAAIAADLKFYSREGAMNLYTGYRQHDYHFVIYGAMFLGQLAPARAALDGLRETTPEDALRIESPPMADYFEAYLAFEPHVLVRFGLWQDCLALAPPEDPVLYATLDANRRYARTVALAALGRPAEARAEQQGLLAACDAVPEGRLLHNNPVRALNEVAKAMAEGEILYREGDHDAAFAELRRAVALEDGLAYDEPWGWMQPVRHALGALLLEQGRVDEAEAAFREDLGLGGAVIRAQVHPDNVWALRGLHDCLAARGETAERRMVAQKLAVAEARADRPIRAACGCARAAMAAAPDAG